MSRSRNGEEAGWRTRFLEGERGERRAMAWAVRVGALDALAGRTTSVESLPSMRPHARSNRL